MGLGEDFLGENKVQVKTWKNSQGWHGGTGGRRASQSERTTRMTAPRQTGVCGTWGPQNKWLQVKWGN